MGAAAVAILMVRAATEPTAVHSTAGRALGSPGQQPVRVMHVIDRLQPGGMELGVVKIVNGLDPAAVASSICSTRPTAIRHVVADTVPVHELQRRQGNDPRFVWALLQLFRRERPDIVHTHAWGTLLEGLSAARAARVPVVIHGEHGTLQLKPMQVRAQRFAWGRVDRLLAVSTRLAERMAAETGFPLPRIQTIRNGVDLSRFGRMSSAAARTRLGLPANELVIGTMGRLVPVKDQASLIAAAALLRDQGLNPIVVLAGDGPLRGDLEAQATAAGLGDRVRCLGHRDDPEVVLAATDVYVLPSVSEGLPNTVLEAMATGRPVVATRVGGVDELVEDDVTGFVVPPRDPRALAGALAMLLGDEELRRAMAAAGRSRAESEFALSGMIRRYEALYTSAAQAVGQRRGQR